MVIVTFKARMKTSEFKPRALFTEATIWFGGCRHGCKGLMYPSWKTVLNQPEPHWSKWDSGVVGISAKTISGH